MSPLLATSSGMWWAAYVKGTVVAKQIGGAKGWPPLDALAAKEAEEEVGLFLRLLVWTPEAPEPDHMTCC